MKINYNSVAFIKVVIYLYSTINNHMKKREKTEHNPKSAGRYPMFKKKFGTSKRISVTIPDKKEKEIKKEIDIILLPYKNV